MKRLKRTRKVRYQSLRGQEVPKVVYKQLLARYRDDLKAAAGWASFACQIRGTDHGCITEAVIDDWGIA